MKSTRIYVGLVVFVVVMGLAFILPRLGTKGDFGLSAGAGAAITFLALVAVAGIVALVLLVMTLVGFKKLPAGARLAGLLPLPLLVAAGFVVAAQIQERKAERERQRAAPPATTTVPVPTKSPGG